MKKQYYIITGTSRGIGEALVKSLMAEGNVVFCIARNNNPGLKMQADYKDLEMYEMAMDLLDIGKIGPMMKNIFKKVEAKDVEGITLINNAGTIHPIRRVGSGEGGEAIMRNVTVNLTAAMIVTDHFVRETESWSCPRKVVNLSTGAAARSIPGWSAYCSAKAGLKMYAACLSEEQAGRANPVQVVSFAPGVVDTEMQAEIRHAEPEAFPQLQKFKDYKEQGQLLSPLEVAEKMIEFIHSPEFGQERDVDVRNMI